MVSRPQKRDGKSSLGIHDNELEDTVRGWGGHLLSSLCSSSVQPISRKSPSASMQLESSRRANLGGISYRMISTFSAYKCFHADYYSTSFWCSNPSSLQEIFDCSHSQLPALLPMPFFCRRSRRKYARDNILVIFLWSSRMHSGSKLKM